MKHAILAIWVLGCGSSSHVDNIDAPFDELDAAPVATVTVHVLGADGASAANLQVLFSDANGALVADVRTSGLGVATATMAAGGTATVIDEPNFSIYTTTDIPLGASFEVAVIRTFPNDVPRTVSWPAASGLENYDMRATCFAPSNRTQMLSQTLDATGFCRDGYDLIVLASDAQAMLAPAATVARGFSFAASAIALPGPFKNMIGLSGSITHRPAEAQPLYVQVAPILGQRRVELDGGSATSDAFVSYLPRDTDGYELFAHLTPTDPLIPGQIVARHYDATVTAPTFDVDGIAMRWYRFQSLAVLDEGRSLRWRDVAPTGITPADPDAVTIELNADPYTWRIAMPPSRLMRSGDEVLVAIPDVPGTWPFDPPHAYTQPLVVLFHYVTDDVDAARLGALSDRTRGYPIGGTAGWSIVSVQ